MLRAGRAPPHTSLCAAAWLAAGQGDEAREPPAWPGLAMLSPALAYTARHPSIRLAFEAAAEAAEQARVAA